VLLLRLQLPADPATWSGLPALAVDGLGDAMAAVGAAGGGGPAGVPAGRGGSLGETWARSVVERPGDE